MQPHPSFDRLVEAVLNIHTKQECIAFLDDLCTIKELIDLSQRLDVAILLNEGRSYNDIAAKTKASTTTICRVNRCFTYGEGGYKTIISRMTKEEAEHEV